MPENITDKTALRKTLFMKRALDHRIMDNMALHDRLAKKILFLVRAWQTRHGKKPIIAGYIPIRTEINTRPTLELLRTCGYTLCLPYVPKKDVPLVFLHFEGALIDGAFGAKTPPLEAVRMEPDFLLVPLVGWDQRAQRLGYGGGYYDRSLQYLRAKGMGYALGLAYDAQETQCVPTEATDEPLNALLTPTRYFNWA